MEGLYREVAAGKEQVAEARASQSAQSAERRRVLSQVNRATFATGGGGSTTTKVSFSSRTANSTASLAATAEKKRAEITAMLAAARSSGSR
jgi:hypothetical protein